MPCICQYFTKDKKNKSSQQQSEEVNNLKISESSVQNILTSPVSASELAFLKAEVWSLNASMSDSTLTIQNMQNIIKSLVEQKYELIDELSESKRTIENIWHQNAGERELHATERKELINEIFSIKAALNEKDNLLEKATKQNVELKISVQEANETIYNMGLMFLKMKSSRENLCKAIE